jgi:hypothetical protein
MANATDFKVKRGLVVSTTATILSTVNATSTTTGGLIVSGGAGIAKDLFVAGTISAVNTASALVVKSNISMVSPDAASTITIRMLNSDAISFSGNSGQLFSITDSMTGTIFAVNDISGVPSIEVYDTGEVRLAETFGYVRIPNATSATSTATGALRVDGGVGIGGDLYVGGTVFATTMVGTFTGTASTSTNLSGGATGSIPYQTAAGRTSFIGIGSTGQILQSNGTTATWVSTGSLIAGTAFTATAILNGTAGQILYQSAPGVTAFAGPGTAGQILVSAGTSAPVYTSTASIYVGNSARVDTTAQTANTNYYPTFVDANNASAANELVYTTSSFVINPSTGNVGIGATPGNKLTVAGNIELTSENSIIFPSASIVKGGSALTFNIGSYYLKATQTGQVTTNGVFGVNTATPASSLHVVGDARITGITTVSNTTVASSTITGAFQVAGGVGVGGDIYAGRNLSVIATGASTNANAQVTFNNNTVYSQAPVATGTNLFIFGGSNQGGVGAPNILIQSTGNGNPYNPQIQMVSQQDGGAFGPLGVINFMGFANGRNQSGSAIIGYSPSSGGTTIPGGLRFYTNNGATTTTTLPITTLSLQLDQNSNATFYSTSATTSSLTGALVVTGGVGIGGGVFVGGTVTATNFVGSFNGTVSTATSILTSAQPANATYYPTFVDANNATATAELVHTTSSFVINPSTGAVGIGASSPTGILDVRSANATSINSYLLNTVAYGTGVQASTFNLGKVESGTVQVMGSVSAFPSGVSNSTEGELSFSTRAAGVVSERLRINNLGKVGIGTVSPASLLHVAGDARITGITTVTNNTAASSTITGAFQVVGGIGIGGNSYIGGNEFVTGALQVNSTNANTATNTSNAFYTAGGAWIDKTLVVGGDTTFKGSVVFQGTNTFVYSSSTVYTDNLISLHAPSGSTPGNHTWTVDDGKDIGFMFHYYKGSDKDAFLGFANDTQYLEWYSNGVESGGIFTGTSYGIFKTGGIRLVGGESNSGNTTTGDLQVLGGVGISGGVFVGGTVTATSFVGSFNGSIVGAATQVNTVQQTANATYYPTFVDSNNVSAGGESVYTTSSFSINPSTGNVGIGNTTPLYKLHVNTAATVGTAASVLSNSTPILYLDSGAAANGAIVIKSHSVGNNNVHGAVKFASSPDASNYSWSGIAGVADTNGAASNLVFYTATGNAQATSAGASTERMRLDINGNLGIGATPASRLHIEGASVATNIIATSGNGIIRLGSSVSGANRKEFTTILDTTNNRVDLQAVWQGITTLPITINASGGNVGIGLTAPASLLHVAGDARITGITTVTNTTVATSTITGAFQVVGGAGIGGALFVGGQVNITSGVVSTNTGTGALVVNGGVGINGALNAITKSFNIGHPTKPGMTLRYGSLEGPEFGVYVRGRLKGSNTIELPEYWTKLVDPDTITVNLTPVGSHQKLYVEDIVNNTIIVGNENIFGKAIDCFYTVWAERADIDKLQVESE